MAESHRGVWVAPWMGPRGELVLVAVTSRRRKLEERTVPLGADGVAISEAMFARLDAEDPGHRSVVIRPRLARVARLRGLPELHVIA